MKNVALVLFMTTMLTSLSGWTQDIIPSDSQGEYTWDGKTPSALDWPKVTSCVQRDKHGTCKQEESTISSGEINYVFFKNWVYGADIPKNYDLPIHLSLNFVGLSQNTSSLKTEFRVSSPKFPQILLDHASSYLVRQDWQLTKCDGENINMAQSDPANLEAAIAGLRSTDFKQYMNCDLAIVGRVACQIEGDGCDGGPFINGGYTAMVFHNTGIIITWIHGVRYVLNPKSSPDPQKEALVAQGTKTFVKLLKDYGNLLFSLNGGAGDQRKLALEAYINLHRAEIVNALGAIEQNLSGTSAVTKLNVTTSINRAYSYVHTIEGQVNNAYILDDIVNVQR